MSQQTAPYINFHGKCQAAMKFYQAALGGELDLQKMGAGGKLEPAGPGDPIMHSKLAADGAVIMASDGSPDFPPKVGDNLAIALSGKNKASLSQAFDQLSAGGNVKQPLSPSPWGSLFGFMEDKFGITWMVDIEGAGQ